MHKLTNPQHARKRAVVWLRRSVTCFMYGSCESLCEVLLLEPGGHAHISGVTATWGQMCASRVDEQAAVAVGLGVKRAPTRSCLTHEKTQLSTSSHNAGRLTP